MSLLSNGAEPLVPLRHARIGRVGEAGQLPHGWRGEHLESIEIYDVGSRGRPWITLDVGFGAHIPGQFAGLGVAPYLPAAKSATIALAAEITLGEGENVGDVLLILRESKGGGGLVGQAAQSLRITKAPQWVSLSHAMTAEGAVAEPVLMIRRRTLGAGRLALTFRGLAFGKVEDYPDWRFAVARD